MKKAKRIQAPTVKRNIRRLADDFGEPSPRMARAMAVANECRNDVLNETAFERGEGSGMHFGLRPTSSLRKDPCGRFRWHVWRDGQWVPQRKKRAVAGSTEAAG